MPWVGSSRPSSGRSKRGGRRGFRPPRGPGVAPVAGSAGRESVPSHPKAPDDLYTYTYTYPPGRGLTYTYAYATVRCMADRQIGVAVFRITFHQLTEPVVVTSKGRPIGRYVPGSRWSEALDRPPSGALGPQPAVDGGSGDRSAGSGGLPRSSTAAPAVRRGMQATLDRAAQEGRAK